MPLKKLSTKKKASRAEVLEALARESERELLDQIRRLQAQPMNRRTHFLRRRIGLRGSAI